MPRTKGERERKKEEEDERGIDQNGSFFNPFFYPPRYGLGTNSMTGAQKSGLIYGALAFFFALFIAGYFIN